MISDFGISTSCCVKNHESEVQRITTALIKYLLLPTTIYDHNNGHYYDAKATKVCA